MDLKDLLGDLHSKLTKEFIKRIEGGEATAADLSAAAKFLKDNGIDVDHLSNPEVTSLAQKMQLPFGDDEEADYVN